METNFNSSMPTSIFTTVNSPTDASKIHVLEAGKGIWDVMKEIAHSGHQEEAFYVLDVADVVHKHEEWKRLLPRVKPYYAVKCNDNRVVLEVLASVGANFDCASMVEINQVLELGVKTDRIIYANTIKSDAQIRFAASADIQVMTFDNECELYKVKEFHPTAQMVLRLRFDAKKSRWPLGKKFGVSMKDAQRLIALAHQLNINLTGISFHVGSECYEPEVFHRAISSIRDLFDLALTYGYTLNLIDLGGGFPGNRGSSITEFSDIINSSLDQFFPEGCGVDVIAEPGRYYVSSAFTLATRIIGVRKCTADDQGDDMTSYMYYTNDGIYTSFNYLLHEDETTEFTPKLLDPHDGPKYLSSIYGPTCDGDDRISSNAQLPIMNLGDWFVFEDMGAYTLTCASYFNGFPIPKVIPVTDHETWLYLMDILHLGTNRFTVESPLQMMSAGLSGKDKI